MDKHRQISVAAPLLCGNEKRYVMECLDSTWISSNGRFIGEFEAGFARFCGTPHAIACNNGTSALHLALLAHGIGPGDEVVVPSLTYIVTANAVCYCGATPVFADSESIHLNLDPDSLEKVITPRTRGMIVVHLFGHPVDFDRIERIAQRHGLFIVEDAAEAHGALYKGRPVGSLASLATFSFYGNKIMTTGEGGMVTTSDVELDSRIRLFRGQGMDVDRRYWFPVVGYNYRMTNIQAAIGLAQLECIEEHLQARRRVASWYGRYLEPYRDFLNLPAESEWARHSYWMYTIRLKPGIAPERDSVIRLLDAAGIETRPMFYPIHLLPPYQGNHAPMPVAEEAGMRGLCLPTHALLTEEDISYVAGSLGSIVQVPKLAQSRA